MNRNRGQFGYGSLAEEYHDSPAPPYRDDPGFGYQARSQGGFMELADSISSNIFVINNGAMTLDRVLKQLGTNKDSTDLRKKIHETEEKTNSVITETASQFKRLQEAISKGDRTQRLQLERLMGEFKDITQKYHTLQRNVADRAKVFAPPQISAHTSSAPDLINLGADDDSAHLVEQRRRQAQMEVEAVEIDVALLKERETEIHQLETDILDINQIFRELGTMVHEQGGVIDTIEGNIESAHTDVELGTQQLDRASTYQNKARKKKCCLIAILLVVIAVIVIIIVVSVKTKK